MTNQKMVVGSEEWCSFPNLDIPFIKARVDSGAKTSSLHAINIQKFTRNNQSWVSFDIHPLQRNRRVLVHCEAPVVDQRTIKSSNGTAEKRYVIRTALKLNDVTWDVELTLTNRDSMGYRMLLGREAMTDRLLIDPSANCNYGEISEDTLKQHYHLAQTESRGLKIGLLASNPELYSNQRIMEAGEERGHEMYFLNISQCYIRLDAETPEVHYRDGRILNDLDAVIPRIKPAITFYGCALTRQFEALNVFALNGSSAISESRDKLFALQKMLSHGLEIPTSGFAKSPVDTKDLIEMVGGAPLIVKLLEGTQGKGVVLAETQKAAESVINAFKSLKANLLVQEFVKEAEGKDLRCFVIDGKVIASIERKAADGDFRANIHQGGTASIVKISPEEKSLALRATKALGLKVAGVDIIRSRKGPLLLEVNSSPGLQGIEEATGKDLAGAMIASIEKARGWKKEKEEELMEKAL